MYAILIVPIILVLYKPLRKAWHRLLAKLIHIHFTKLRDRIYILGYSEALDEIEVFAWTWETHPDMEQYKKLLKQAVEVI